MRPKVLRAMGATSIKSCAAKLRKDPSFHFGDQYQSEEVAAKTELVLNLTADQLQEKSCQPKTRRVAGSRFEVLDMLFVLFAEQPQ
eukprot:COSAG05_NODE_805_length_7205_cov_12.164650_5_plen_86_part_00